MFDEISKKAHESAAMNVLIIRNAQIQDFGGGERIPVILGSQLTSYHIHPIIISRSPKLIDFAKINDLVCIKGWWWSRQNWSGIRQLLLPLYVMWQLILFFWYIAVILRTSAKVVHPMSKDDFIAATLAAKILGRKVIWSDYADLKYIYQNHKIWYKNPIGKIIWKLSRFADTIILTSDNDKRLIQHNIGTTLPDRYQVIHYGVLAKEVEVIPRRTQDKGKIIFAATSRLVTTKGIRELIDAFNLISENRDDLCLWIFGEGPDRKLFEDQARNNQRITFFGFPPDTLSRIADADIFVHPSYLEGFSISLVEAAKLRLPIIACDVGGNPELVIDGLNGLLIPPREVKSLAAAMKQLADSRETRIRLAQNARKAYEDNLVFEDIIRRRIVPLYKD